MGERHAKRALRAHKRRALRTLRGGLGRARFSSTLARAFFRGSLLSPVERVSLQAPCSI